MSKYPLSFMGELLEFTIRAFSHIDDQNEAALKKDPQRLKKQHLNFGEKTETKLETHLGSYRLTHNLALK